MDDVKGISGYGSNAAEFVAATATIDFGTLHQPSLELIPAKPARILDIGAGAGRDAAALAAMGHSVVAVEPATELLSAAQTLHADANIHWLDDALPELKKLGTPTHCFDFILATAVWHHLDPEERETALRRIADLIRAGGIFALSLRNGPPGMGTHTFPTDYRKTVASAVQLGFEPARLATGQPRLIAGKVDVSWSKLAFKRR